MFLSLNQVLSHAKARPIILMPAALLVVAVIGYLIFSKPSKERLIKNLTSQLREEQFEQLYAEADDQVHLNVTKERFVKRMKVAVAKLKTIDENLAFQVDAESEIAMGRNGGESLMFTAFQKLEKDGKSVTVSFNWSSDGRFSDLWAVPTPGTSEDYGILGVSGQYYTVGNQVMDW